MTDTSIIVSTPIDPATGTITTYPSVLAELYYRGLAIPDITRVMYNTGTKTIYKLDPKTHQPILDDNGNKIVESTYPTLATVVYWADNSKTTVVNSINDPIHLTDGTPNRLAKEIGLIYAYAKRCMVGRYEVKDGKLTVVHEGFGRTLNDLIDNSYDCQEEEVKRKAAKEAAAKKHAEIQAAAAAKHAKNPSLAESVRELKACIDLLKADLEAAKKPAAN